MRNICESSPSLSELSAFLSDYSSWLLGSGATCVRITKNIDRIAVAYGAKVEITIFPRHIHLTLWCADHSACQTVVVATKPTAISFEINTDLSALSWKIADGKVSFCAARRLFEHIIRGRRRPQWLIVGLVAIANASFCRLFGGDGIAMGVVAVATAVGFMLRNLMLGRHIDSRAVWFVCALVSSIFGATDMLFSLGSTPSVALATSVLYLVPGVPFLNSFSDMLYRHYICAFSRFADAVVLTCCLSAGLCLGMALMNIGMF